MKVILLPALLHLIGADVLVMPPASPATTLALRMASSTRFLPLVDVAHDGDHRRTRQHVDVLVGHVEDAELERRIPRRA